MAQGTEEGGRALLIRRQRILAEFGELALRSDSVDEILTEACRLVSEALGTPRAKVLEIQADGASVLVRGGVGWAPGIVGRMVLAMEEHSSESYSVRAGQPVTTQDIARETRFRVPAYMRAAGVVALANAPIRLPGGRPWGVLQVDDVRPREFGEADTEFLRTYTTILGPVIDRLLKLSELRAAEQRFRLIVEAARDYAIFVVDPEDRVTDWLPGAEAVFGWPAKAILGQPAALLFTPEDQAAGVPARETALAAASGMASNVRWHLRRDGTRVLIEGSVRALHTEDGRLRGFLKIGQDMTERRTQEEALRESETRFRQFGEASPDLLWIRDAESLAFEYVSPAFDTLFGRSRGEQLERNTLEAWLELLLPEDRETAASRLRQVSAGESLSFEFRVIRPSDGELRWIRNSDFPLRNSEGRVPRIAGIAEDVTEKRASAARLEVLVAELQHRARNLIGVISSVAARTLERGGSVADFRVRLQALSRAQGLLSRSGTDTVELSAMVRAELAAHAEATPERVRIEGPRVTLTSVQVQNFALALHELTTNAVKYGALRGSEGRLHVSWRVEPRDGGRYLVLDWVESGVHLAPESSERRGYGRELIEKALSYALRAHTDYVLGKDGVRCRIELPLA